MLRKICSVVLVGAAALSAVSMVYGSTVFDSVGLEGVKEYESLIDSIDSEYGIDKIKIIDMDKDNIPELTVLYGSDKSNIQVYTLSDDNAVKVYDYNEENTDGSSQIDVELTKGTDGIVYAAVFEGNDSKFDLEFMYKDGDSLKRKIDVSYNSEDINAKYLMDNTVVTKSVFDATVKKYMDIGNDTSSAFNFAPRIEMDKKSDVDAVIKQAKAEKDDNIIQVLINGESLITDNDPVIANGTTMVPMRDIFEALDAKIDWEGATKSVIATKGSKAIKLTVNSNEAVVNGNTVVLDNAPYINSNGTTMVPLRFISEALGAKVEWNGEDRIITITL